jgi:hypothetical protein
MNLECSGAVICHAVPLRDPTFCVDETQTDYVPYPDGDARSLARTRGHDRIPQRILPTETYLVARPISGTPSLPASRFPTT